MLPLVSATRLPIDNEVSAAGDNIEQPINNDIVMAKSHVDQVTTAEIKWMPKVVENDLPFRVCDGVQEHYLWGCFLELFHTTSRVVQ